MYTSDIIRNFNAEEYRDSGYIKAISPTDDGIIVKRVGSQDILKQISKVEVNYFSNDWIDTSAISMIDFGDVFELYQVESSVLRQYAEDQIQSDSNGKVTVWYSQSRKMYTYEWSILSLDNVLGFIGGFSGLLWSMLALLFGGYEAFKLDNSLIGAVYPTLPPDDDLGSTVHNE